MALFLGLMTSRTGSYDVTNNRDLPTPEYLEGVDDTSFFYGTRLEHSPHGGSCVCEQQAHVHGGTISKRLHAKKKLTTIQIFFQWRRIVRLGQRNGCSSGGCGQPLTPKGLL